MMCVARPGAWLWLCCLETWSAAAEPERVHDFLAGPNIFVSSMMDPWRQGRDGPSVMKGHSFTITCSVQPQYPGGSFNLLFSGSNDPTHSRPALNHTAHFLFPAAVSAQQGNYTCVYLVTFRSRLFASRSSVLSITIWKDYEEVMLVWGSSPCDGRQLPGPVADVSEQVVGLEHAARQHRVPTAPVWHGGLHAPGDRTPPHTLPALLLRLPGVGERAARLWHRDPLAF